MVFVGVHTQWGRIDVTQADLGCGQQRESIYKTKKPAPVSCYECQWQLHLVHRTPTARMTCGSCGMRTTRRNARRGLRARACSTTSSSFDIAHHARAAGWSAEFEVAAPDGSWRADVLVTSPDGGRRAALEAQMAAMAVTDIEARTDRYTASGIEVCWFTDRKTVPWLDAVPSVQIARPEDGGAVQVTAGAARFVPDWCEDRDELQGPRLG